MILPGSWAGVLEPLRPVFRRRGTFVLFTVLATGMVATVGRRSVVGMLAGARMAQQISFHAACRFFSHAVWDIDRLGLVVARMVVTRLLGPGEPVTVVIDDTLFKRWGRHVHGAFWTHDGAAQGGKKIARGNRWVVAGIVVRLPFCTAPVCLPVLLRLWAGKGTTTPVELAAQLLKLLVAEFPGPAGARGRGRRLPRQAAAGARGDVDDPATGQRLPVRHRAAADRAPRAAGVEGPQARPAHRPGRRGDRRGHRRGLAEDRSVYRYGRTETVQLAERACIWYGSFGNRPGRCVLLRELGSANAYDLALFTLDPAATPAQIVERYAIRWSIEPANAVGKQQMGVGQARNRVKNAVERTVPFGMLVQSLVVIWYALHGHHPDDALARRLAQPWYQSKTEPSFEDMITKLRKTLIVARFTPVSPGQPNPDLLHDYALACAAAAA